MLDAIPTTLVAFLRAYLPDTSQARQAADSLSAEALWTGPLMGPTTMDGYLAKAASAGFTVTFFILAAIVLASWLRWKPPTEQANRLALRVMLGVFVLFAAKNAYDGAVAFRHAYQGSEVVIVLAPTRIVRLEGSSKVVYPATAVNAVTSDESSRRLSFSLNGNGTLTIDAEGVEFASISGAADRLASEATNGSKTLRKGRA